MSTKYVKRINIDGEKTLLATFMLTDIKCWATIGTPAKRHLNGVWLEGR